MVGGIRSTNSANCSDRYWPQQLEVITRAGRHLLPLPDPNPRWKHQRLGRKTGSDTIWNGFLCGVLSRKWLDTKKEHACRMHNWKSRNRRITNLKLQFSYWIAIPSASSSPSPLHSDATWPVPGRLAKRANSSNRKIGKDGIPPGKDRWLVASHSHWSWFIMRPFGSGASAIYFHYGDYPSRCHCHASTKCALLLWFGNDHFPKDGEMCLENFESDRFTMLATVGHLSA